MHARMNFIPDVVLRLGSTVKTGFLSWYPGSKRPAPVQDDRSAESARKRQKHAATPQKDRPGSLGARATPEQAPRHRSSGPGAPALGRSSDQGRAGDSSSAPGFAFQPPGAGQGAQRRGKENDDPARTFTFTGGSLVPQLLVLGREHADGEKLASLPEGLLDPHQLRVSKEYEHKKRQVAHDACSSCATLLPGRPSL